MVDRDTLYEQYEEAVLALLMEQVADAEGEELLQQNRSLQADPAAAVPAETEKRCLDVLRRQSRKTRRQRTARRSLRIAARLAAALVSLLVLYAIAFAASETVRVHTLNFLIREYDVGTQFLFPGDESTQTAKASPDLLAVLSEAVPSGFSLVSTEENQFENSYQFQNETGNEILVQIWYMQDAAGTVTIDTEEADVVHQTIHGQDVMIVSKVYTDQNYQIVWVDEIQQYMVDLIGRDVALDDLLPIAEAMLHG